MIYGVLVMSALMLGADESASDRFSAVEIEKPFDQYSWRIRSSWKSPERRSSTCSDTNP